MRAEFPYGNVGGSEYEIHAIQRKANIMQALVQTKASTFAPFKAIEALFKPMEARLKPTTGPVLPHELHEYPVACSPRSLPLTIRDEMLELYAFIFCQGGFPQLGMTFEQFLLVAAAIKPIDLRSTREEL